MRRALDLARRGGRTSPNPRVGCVLVRSGEVVGEGRHEGPGRPHAEVVALAAAGPAARSATAYVTLEPCNHHGLTPPCAPALVAAGVEHVVVAMEDPDGRVQGAGLKLLRESGVEVTPGVCEAEARDLLAAYIHQRSTGRPLLRLKLALTLDGRLAAPDGSARWITGEGARRVVHRRRREVDGVMVGAGTVLADDPSLDVRLVDCDVQPVAVIVDARGSVPPNAGVLARPGAIVATTTAAPHEVQTSWKEAGAEVVELPPGRGGVDLGALLEHLGGRGWLEVLCEGGAALATSLLAEDLVDRLELHYGAVTMGGNGPAIGELGAASMSRAHRWSLLDVQRLEDDVLVVHERAGG